MARWPAAAAHPGPGLRRGEAVQDQLDVRDAVKQQRAVHDVERARRYRDRAQVPEDGLVSRRATRRGRPGRAVLVDRQHRDHEAAGPQLVQAEFVGCGQGPGPQQADRTADAAAGVLADRLREQLPHQRLAVGPGRRGHPRLGGGLPRPQHRALRLGVFAGWVHKSAA
jgi:hypothetical protein